MAAESTDVGRLPTGEREEHRAVDGHDVPINAGDRRFTRRSGMDRPRRACVPVPAPASYSTPSMTWSALMIAVTSEPTVEPEVVDGFDRDHRSDVLTRDVDLDQGLHGTFLDLDDAPFELIAS